MPDSEIAKRFDCEMLNIYLHAKKECNYTASRFLQMLEDGGVKAAKSLINAPVISEGFERLWKEERLDLTVEALALRDPWNTLFTPEELKKARQRLDDLNYKGS